MSEESSKKENITGHSYLAHQVNRPGEPTSPIPQISWDVGTAYDLFFSQHVLHIPEKFGLRPSWAAGVRSRLTNEERKTLLEAQRVIKVPLCWLHSLPAPKDSETVLWSLRSLAPEERLPKIMFCGGNSDEYELFLLNIAEKQIWNEDDLETLKYFFGKHDKEIPRSKELRTIMDVWSNSASFGERYLTALESYQRAFFAEEQKRIKPSLISGLKRAQDLAERLSTSELIENLSRGIHFEEDLDVSQLILVPSYWISPLIYFSKIKKDTMLVVFGSRPENASLVPGEQVPDSILLGLKALSDPTRLKILRYLTHDNLTPADLARRLRLRAPTVTHHLRALRLAGLVHVTLVTEHVSRYSARLESIDELCGQIKNFMTGDNEREEVAE